MAFLGVYRAIYDYAPQSEGELEVAEGDLLFVLEKSTEDDWWKAKKKAQSDDEDEPEGLVPKTYIEEVCSNDREHDNGKPEPGWDSPLTLCVTGPANLSRQSTL